MAERINGKSTKLNGSAARAVVEPASVSDNTASESAAPDTIAGFDAIDPGSIGNADSGGTGKRGRGRPKGSTAKSGTSQTKAETKTANITGLEGILITIHIFAANALSCPELQLAEDESKHLARAIQNVNEQYNTVLNPKVMAWVSLSLVAGSIYGTRIVAIRARQLAAAGTRPTQQKVVDIKPEPKGKVNGDARTPADLYGPTGYSGSIPGAAPDIF